MSVNLRKRTSSSEDMQKVKAKILKPKLHKISLYVEAEDIKKMKKKAVDENLTLTDIFQMLVKDYLS